jgi:sulfur dioxygenase
VSGAGVPEPDADWVNANGPRLSLIDVREPEESYGSLGHLPGAELIPLGVLPGRVASLPRERPVITVCRSGGRSGKAALQLTALGFQRVASLRGGILEWARREPPAEYGRPPRDDRQG